MIYVVARKNNLGGLGVYCHIKKYFSYIVAVSFIGVGNWRKLPNPSQVTDKLYCIM